MKQTALALSCLLLILQIQLPVFAATILDPFNGTEEYSVTGGGTALDPYVIGLTGSNNRIPGAGLDLMKSQAPEAIWLVQHKVNGKIDYTLRFSTSIADVINAPLTLDVTAWQEEEGILNVEVGEKDSRYMPATLSLDVSGYSGFSEGTSVTVGGKTSLRTIVKNGFVEFALNNGGDHILTAEGFEKSPEEKNSTHSQESDKQIWDKPNDTGEAVARQYTRAGTVELPFVVDLSSEASALVRGDVFSNMKNSGQSRSFQWSDENGRLVWSYFAEARRLRDINLQEEFDFAIDISGSAGKMKAVFSQKGRFPGKLAISIYVEEYFRDASIVSIKSDDKDTKSVVDRGYITFWIEQGGIYTVSDTGETVASAMVADARAVSEDTRDNIYTQNKYKGTGLGTEDEPLTILAKLDDTFHASWKSMNTIAGYAATFNPSEDSYDGTKLSKVMVEYRSDVTGKLIASVYIDGSQWRITPESMKGPYYLDYKLNPNAATIEAALDAHSLYTGKYASRKAGALETLTHYSQSPDTLLFFMRRTRSFAGVINYTLDVSRYYKPGDLVNINYVLGSCNGDLYHGEAPKNAELLLEEASYSKYDLQTLVNASGYILFPVYTGGFFTVSKFGETQEKEDSYTTKALSDGEGAEYGLNTKEKVTTKQELINETVAKDTHTETGVLVNFGQKDLKDSNFSANSEDGRVYAAGYISEENVSLSVSDETERLRFNLSDGKIVVAGYDINLKKQSGFKYTMNEGDYLDIRICLGETYSVYDESLLFVRCVGDDGQLTNEIFSSHSELETDGNMYFTFRTTHLSKFVIVKTTDKNELLSAVALKQEHTSEASTVLAEQSLQKEDENKTMKMILILTVSVFALFVIVTDIRRRRLKEVNAF